MKCALCGGDPSLPVLARWEIFLPIEPPSQNQVGGNKGAWSTRADYRQLRDEATWRLLAAKRKMQIPDAIARRRLRFSRLWSREGRKRGADRDAVNNAGGMKGLLDAMIKARIITGDRPDQVEDYYYQRQIKGNPGVEIVVEDIDWEVETWD